MSTAGSLAGARRRLNAKDDSLRRIELRWQKFGFKGAKALAGALERGSFPALEHVALGNNIGVEGARALAQALARGSFPKLQNIWINENDFGDEMRKQVRRAVACMHCRLRLVAFLGAELDRSPVTPAKRLLWRDGDRAVMVRVVSFLLTL